VEAGYFDFFDMKIVAGENPFFYESAAETDVVINESAARLLGYEQPVGEMIVRVNGARYTIRGVVRNAYTKSLHQEIEPQIYTKLTSERWGYVFFKISGDPQRAIAVIEQKWKEREADYPFEYHFLDDTYKQLYTAEMNSGKVLSFAMLITLIITVAGLFAMAYYATQRRVREIAIRKVYGATIKDIFMLLNKDFILWIAIAFVIACPIAYYGIYRWLEGFVVKTSLSAWVFLLVGMIAFLITLLTTGFQTWKAARENPVKAIKTD
jgi:putative ABC transport system permease protein